MRIFESKLVNYFLFGFFIVFTACSTNTIDSPGIEIRIQSKHWESGNFGEYLILYLNYNTNGKGYWLKREYFSLVDHENNKFEAFGFTTPQSGRTALKKVLVVSQDWLESPQIKPIFRNISKDIKIIKLSFRDSKSIILTLPKV